MPRMLIIEQAPAQRSRQQPTGTAASLALAALRERIGRIERPESRVRGVLPFGVAAIDRILPGGGLPLGAVHEILGRGGDEEDGAAAAGFAAGILARVGAGAGSGPVLWCLPRPDLYGPGLAEHGLDPARLVIVAVPRDGDLLWAMEEGLRPGSGLVAVVGEIGRLPMVASRRLQLAAEHSGIIALVLRRWRNGTAAAAERGRPSAAVTRWRVAALPSRPVAGRPGIGVPQWRVELLRCRGGRPGQWEVEAADATGHVCVPAELADRPATARAVATAALRRAG
jgi:protein ImuA